MNTTRLAQNTLEYLSRFDCDDAIDVWVASAINDAHGSAPDFFENFVAADKASSLNPPQNRRQTGAANLAVCTVQSLQGVLGPYGQCAPSLRRVRSSLGISTLTRQETFPGSLRALFLISVVSFAVGWTKTGQKNARRRIQH